MEPIEYLEFNFFFLVVDRNLCPPLVFKVVTAIQHEGCDHTLMESKILLLTKTTITKFHIPTKTSQTSTSLSNAALNKLLKEMQLWISYSPFFFLLFHSCALCCMHILYQIFQQQPTKEITKEIIHLISKRNEKHRGIHNAHYISLSK